jgi:hypothetical protein
MVHKGVLIGGDAVPARFPRAIDGQFINVTI